MVRLHTSVTEFIQGVTDMRYAPDGRCNLEDITTLRRIARCIVDKYVAAPRTQLHRQYPPNCGTDIQHIISCAAAVIALPAPGQPPQKITAYGTSPYYINIAAEGPTNTYERFTIITRRFTDVFAKHIKLADIQTLSEQDTRYLRTRPVRRSHQHSPQPAS
jgi:hypothetical protein